MELMMYAKNLKGKGEQIQVALNSINGDREIGTFDTLDELKLWLLTADHNEAVIVLVAEKREELAELMQALPLFRKVKIILMLPDREPETIKIGYKLEPRFLSFLDGGFSILSEIVKNMLTSAGSDNKTGQASEPDGKAW